MATADDTIVAIGSPPGGSMRGLVRASGPAVMSILGHLLQQPDTGVDQVQAWPLPRRLVGCRVCLAPVAGADHPWLVLPVMVTLFLAPRSYTGQDMFELQCPGNRAILDRLLERMVELGARRAEAGELTFRAFLAGKLDLTQAEGVAATIAATSDSQLQAATLLRQGQLGRFAQQLASDVGDQLAQVEAGIDFSDQEDVVTITPAQLGDRLGQLTQQLDDFLGRSHPWSVVEAPPRVVLAGAPNSGKSTLFNALLGRQRAVACANAHTTRDVLTEPLTLETPTGHRLELMLVDIAGLDTPHDTVDHQAQAAAQDAIDHADLLLLTSDIRTFTAHGSTHTPAIRVRTKADLIHSNTTCGPFDVTLSAKTGHGLDQLRTTMAQKLGDRAVSVTGQMFVLQPRHEAAFRQALHHLKTTQAWLSDQRQTAPLHRAELVAAALGQALNELTSLGGQLTPEDILSRVFSTFCIGK